MTLFIQFSRKHTPLGSDFFCHRLVLPSLQFYVNSLLRKLFLRFLHVDIYINSLNLLIIEYSFESIYYKFIHFMLMNASCFQFGIIINRMTEYFYTFFIYIF